MSKKDKIDWLDQWQQHAPHFREGYLHLKLSDYGWDGEDREVKLKPGGGFGDLSHATTELTLRLMLPRVKGTCLVDIGCGSGILCLAGAAAGARDVLAVDIDQEAIRHTKENAKLNRLKVQVVYPKKFPVVELHQPLLIVMNMIRTEQKEAWSALPCLHDLSGVMITSGILWEDKGKAIEQYTSWGWVVEAMTDKDGWVAFLLRK